MKTERFILMGRRHGAGFSILELMVTITVLSVLLAIAVPSFRGVMRRNSVSSAAGNLMGDLQYARGEAATRHKFVSLCRSTDGKTCAADAATTSYEQGWLVYSYDADVDGPNQSFTPTKADHELLRVGGLQDRVSIEATDGNVMTFGQSGLPMANAGRTNENFVVCIRPNGVTSGPGENSNETPGSQITIGASGSVASSQVAVGAPCTAG